MCLWTAHPALADEAPAWTVTCTDGARVVFSARVKDSSVAMRSLEIKNQFPSATCVSIGAAPPEPELLPLGGTGIVAVPIPFGKGRPPTGSPSGLTTGAPSLDAALRALRGEPVYIAPPVSAAPTKPQLEAPEADYAAPPPEPGPSDLEPASGRWVRLAVFKGVELPDVFAAWRLIAAADPLLLGSMTPSVSEKGALVALNAGPVAPSERVEVCVTAARLGLDCLFGKNEEADEDAFSMNDFLAFLGPDRAEAKECARRAAGEIASDAASGMDQTPTSGRQCWMSHFAIAESRRLASAPPLPLEVAVTPPEAAPPASSSAPPSRTKPASGRRHRANPRPPAPSQPLSLHRL